jgi:hypothetical protein
MHNFDIARGFSDTTILFCRSCGLSYRLTTWKDRPDQPGRATWERMTVETPGTDVISIAPCRVETSRARGSEDQYE